MKSIYISLTLSILLLCECIISFLRNDSYIVIRIINIVLCVISLLIDLKLIQLKRNV